MSIFAQVVADIHSTLNDRSVKAMMGRRALTVHEQARRVVWVRGLGSVTGVTSRVGGTRIVNDDASVDRRRIIYTLNEAVSAHIFAETEDIIEQLFSSLIASMKVVLQANWLPGAYEWETETGGNQTATGNTARGVKLRFDSVWMLPTTDEITPLTIVTGQTHGCEIDSADGSSTEAE